MRPILRMTAVAGLVGIAALNTGCADGAFGNTDTSVSATCSGTYSPAFEANLTITRLIVDGRGLLSTFDQNGSYDAGSAACFDEAANTAVLIFEVGGDAYGKITVGSSATGSLAFNDAEGTLEIDLFGENVPVVFSKSQFTTGTWIVDSITPSLKTDVKADASSAGRILQVTFDTDVTP